jgi:hypothetical protein
LILTVPAAPERRLRHLTGAVFSGELAAGGALLCHLDQDVEADDLPRWARATSSIRIGLLLGALLGLGILTVADHAAGFVWADWLAGRLA